MFYFPFLEGDGPVGIVFTHWGGDREASWKLCVNGDFGAGVEILCECPLDFGVGEDVVVDVIIRFEGLAEVVLALLGGEDVGVEALVDGVVTEMLNHHRGLLFLNESGRLGNEVLRVISKLVEDREVEAFEDRPHGASSELSAFGNLSEEVIADA